MWSLQSLNTTMNSSVHITKEEAPSAISILCASLPWRKGLNSWALQCCKAILSVQYLHTVPHDLELQEKESIYCIKERKTIEMGT